MRVWLFLAAVNGLAAMIAGAYAAHGIHQAGGAAIAAQGATYHMFHALALLGVAWLADRRPGALSVTAAGVLFTVGIVLFSGSLYAIGMMGWRMGLAPPFGGAALMAGWLMLAWTAVRSTGAR